MKIKINKISILHDLMPVEFSSKDASISLASYYKSPNKVLEALVADGELIRLKKGLFVLRDRFDPLTAAGSIHGPSYVSFETALGFYDMIPERVTTIFSVVDHRQLQIRAGGILFVYRSQNRKLFSEGMTSKRLGDRNLLIATPEKALLDTIAWSNLNTKNLSQDAVFNSICNSLRLNEQDLFGFRGKHLRSLARQYRNRAPDLFACEWSKRKAQRRT